MDVYVILDRTAAGGRDLIDLGSVLLEAGVRWLQLRDKQAGAGELLALARRLRELPATARSRLVAVTGWGQPTDRQLAAEAGFDDYMVKPVEIERIQAILRRHAPESSPAS